MKPFVDICHSRVQNNEPPFVVTYCEEGERKYEFFALRFAAEGFYQRKLADYKNSHNDKETNVNLIKQIQ